MNHAQHIRRGIVLALATVSLTFASGGAAGASSISRAQPPTTPVDVPSPPVTLPPTAQTPTDDAPPTTIAPPTTVAPSTTVAPPTTAPPAHPTTTVPSAIATTTTQPAIVAEQPTQEAVVSPLAATKPSAPQSPKATPGNGSVTLTWLAPASTGGAPIDKYAVQRYNPATSAWENLTFPPSAPYTKSGLVNGTKYSFRILAHNAVGWGPVSTVVSATPRTVPGAPSGLQATPSDNYVALDWSAPANGGAPIDKYRVQLATSPNGPWTTYVGVNGSLPAGGFAYPEVQNGHTYWFRVAAHNAAGWGPYGSAVSAVPRTVPSIPGLYAQPVSTTQVELDWTRPADGGAPIDLYRIEIKQGDAGSWTVVASWAADTSVASGSRVVTNLKPGTLYYFRIQARNAAGWGSYGTTFTTTPATTPGAPLACTAVESSYHMAYIDWGAPASDGGSSIVNYNLLIDRGEYKYQYVGSSGYWYWHSIAIVLNYDTAGPSTDYTALLSGGDYRISIRARNNIGQGPGCIAEVHIS